MLEPAIDSTGTPGPAATPRATSLPVDDELDVVDLPVEGRSRPS